MEACLNSRPLSALSTDPTDLSALTPGHFLVGSLLITVPEPRIKDDARISKVSRWFLLSKMKEEFWRRWNEGYLWAFQQRLKWRNEQKNVEVGDLVLILNEHLPPSKWLLARVIEVYPGMMDSSALLKYNYF